MDWIREQANPRNWPRKWQKRGLWVAVILVVYTVVGFFVLPPIIRSQLVKQLEAATQRPAVVRQVRVNPFALSLTVRGLGLTELNNTPLASFEEFYANFQLSSLFRWAWTFDEITLREPKAALVLDEQGKLNFADLLVSTNKPAQPEETAGIPRVLVFSVTVTNGSVSFADFSRKAPFRTTYTPINLNLKRFTTSPGRQSPHSFAASSDTGRSVTWNGTVTAQPPGSRGSVRVLGVHLPRHGPYLAEVTHAELVNGTFDLGCEYFCQMGTNGLDLVVSNFFTVASDLRLQDPQNSETVLSLQSFELRDAGLDLRNRQARVGSIKIAEPSVLVRRRSDASINLVSLMVSQPTNSAPATNTVAQSAPWEFTLDDFQMENASVDFEDASVPGPFRTLIKPLSLEVKNLTTRTNSSAEFQLQLTTDANERIELAGSGSLNPKQGSGGLQVNAVDLSRYQPYVSPFFKGMIASGKSDLALQFTAAVPADAPEAAITNLIFRVSDLKLQTPDEKENVLALASFRVHDVSASLSDHQVLVGGVDLEKAAISVRREKDGAINLLALINTQTNSAEPAAGVEPAAPGRQAPEWRASIGSVNLSECSLKIEDRTPPKPGLLELDGITAKLHGIQFPSNAPVQTEMTAKLNTSGTVTVNGEALPYTPAFNGEVRLENIDLPRFQPWVEAAAPVAILSGAYGVHGQVNYGADKPALRFAGEMSLKSFAVQEQAGQKELVRWDDLRITGIGFEMAPNRLDVERVQFAGLKTTVIIGPDKRMNFMAAMPASAADTNAIPIAAAPQTSGQPAATNTPAATGTFPVKLNELVLEEASLHFADESVQPTAVFEVKQFGGKVNGLGTEPGTTATFAFAGNIGDASPLGMHGQLKPLAQNLDFALAFTNRSLQLTSFTPYMEKFAGHPLSRGRLSLDLSYTVQGGQLFASNSVRIDQLTLGPRNDSPDATKLPVKLAVALLKDRNGLIALDLPLEGRLDDPEFKVGPIILKVLGNVITKAATSPFKLLGSLVGGGEELGWIEFAAGEARMLDSETNKLAKLVQALADRPALNLEIEGSVDRGLDREALARQMLLERIRDTRVQELTEIGQAPQDAKTMKIEPAHHQRLLRATLVKEFGTNLSPVLREFATSLAETNRMMTQARTNEPEKKSRLARAAGWIPFQKKNSPAAVARRQNKADAALLKQNPEMSALTPDIMERILASKIEVPEDAFVQLMQARAAAVQAALATQESMTDRIFLVTPKPQDPAKPGLARVNLSLN